MSQPRDKILVHKTGDGKVDKQILKEISSDDIELSSGPNTQKCHKCGKPGHKAKNCRSGGSGGNGNGPNGNGPNGRGGGNGPIPPIIINNHPPPPPQPPEKRQVDELGRVKEVPELIIIRKDVPWYYQLAKLYTNFLNKNILQLALAHISMALSALYQHKLTKSASTHNIIVRTIVGWYVKLMQFLNIDSQLFILALQLVAISVSSLIRKYLNRTYYTALELNHEENDLVHRPTKHRISRPEDPAIAVYDVVVYSEKPGLNPIARDRHYLDKKELSDEALEALTDQNGNFLKMKISVNMLNNITPARTLNTHLPIKTLMERVTNLASEQIEQVYDNNHLLLDDNNIIADTTSVAKHLITKSWLKTNKINKHLFQLVLQESTTNTDTGTMNTAVLGGSLLQPYQSGVSPLVHEIKHFTLRRKWFLCSKVLDLLSLVQPSRTLILVNLHLQCLERLNVVQRMYLCLIKAAFFLHRHRALFMNLAYRTLKSGRTLDGGSIINILPLGTEY